MNACAFANPVKFHANLSYTLSNAAVAGRRRVYPRDILTVNLAVEAPLSRSWIFLAEAVGFRDGGRLFGHAPNQPAAALLDIVPGIEYLANRQWNVDAGVRIDVLGKNTAYRATPMLALFYYF